MKMRKLFAGLAAAATLLGGIAFGAAPASAAEPTATAVNCLLTAEPSDKTITINASDYRALITADGDNPTLRTFKVVKLASYSTHAVTDANGQTQYQLSLTTESSVKNAVIAALGNDYNTAYGDPMQQVALSTNNGSDLSRKVADALAAEDVLKDLTDANPQKNLTKGTAADGVTPGTLTMTMNATGVYLIVDQSDTQTIGGKPVCCVCSDDRRHEGG